MNDTIRCFQKLRCFSTPHASLTALVIAPKTPSELQMSASAPATPTEARDVRNESSCVLMKSNCAGKYWNTKPSTVFRSASSAVTDPSSDIESRRKGKRDSNA
jgi:hypothetical protein